MRAEHRDRLYLALPYPLKVAAAARQGRLLRRDRYGGQADALVEQALAADREPAAVLEERQAARHRAVLDQARHVPFYRAWFEEHRDRDPTVPTDWPVVTKDLVRADPTRFLAVTPGRVVHDHTSGTTGTPLDLSVALDGLRGWYALYEARARRWHGVSRHDRWAILGGKMVARAGRRRPPFWVWSPSLRQLYLGANLLRDETIEPMVAALVRARPTHLVGYPSALATLARVALERGLRPPPLAVVIANAEPVTSAQREAIETFFGCPLRETYGMAEMVLGASECGHGTMHLWPEAGVLEVLDDLGRAVPGGTDGRLVATGLLNAAMPLVRYDLGDRGRAPVTGAVCGCGRRLPWLPPVEGRTQDLIHTPTGDRVFWINPVFHGLPIAEAQVRQRQLTELEVLVVPAPGYGPDVARVIERRLRLRVGDMNVAVVEVRGIERGAGGKFRPVVSLLAKEAVAPAVEPSQEAGPVGEVEDGEGRC